MALGLHLEVCLPVYDDTASIRYCSGNIDETMAKS